ncbi:ribosome small subunit-dependent GTPase A [Roseovarius sp.]|jgi:ribosome biogenesis GTPase
MAGEPDTVPVTLEQLGWGPFFAAQVDADEVVATPPVRVVTVHRSGFRVLGEGIEAKVPPRADVTVGDWLLLDRDTPAASRTLERSSLLKRRAPGHDRQVQLIAANIDTVFIVTSCNEDFNIARLERYVALTFESGAEPVIVLTKTDLATDAAGFVEAARGVSDRVAVVALDARAEEPGKALAEWCRPGRTVAFLGSSGVGKSTLTNALAGTEDIATQAVREADARGRHTTTRRQLYMVPGGSIVLDTPGMRELQLADAASGIADVFEDIEALTTGCRFRDCAHDTEPGCAVQRAVAEGRLDRERLARWRKLQEEDAQNSLSLNQRRSKDRAFGKVVRQATKEKPRNR